MGKLSAYLLGMAVSLGLGFYVLSSYYTPLLNWFMPQFGAPLIFIFSILFMLLANPIKWPIVIVCMIILGLAIGIGARRSGRAIGAAITVYLSLWGFAGSALFAIISSTNLLTKGLSSTSGSSPFPFTVTPAPTGTTLATIMAEPLMGRIASAVTTFISSSSTSSGGVPFSTSSFTPIIYEFLPYALVNLAILLISAGITGKALGNIIKKRGKGYVDGKKSRKPYITVIAILFIAAMILPALSMGNVQQSPQHSTQIPGYATTPLNMMATPFSTAQYNNSSFDVGGSLVGTQGNLYSIYGNFAHVSNTGNKWFNGPANSATVVVETANLYEFLQSLNFPTGTNLSFPGYLSSQYSNLIPSGLIIMLYAGNVSSTSSYASSELNSLSSVGVNQTTSLISASSFPLGGFGNGSIYLYSFNAATYTSENGIVNSLNGSISNSGTAAVFNSLIRSGTLVPSYTSDSYNSSIFFAGYVSGGSILGNIFKGIGLNLSSGGSYVGDGGIFMKSGFAHSSSTNHSFSLASMLSYKNTITFSNSSTQYGIFMGVPEKSGTGTVYNTTVISTSSSLSGLVPASNNVTVSTGYSINPSTVIMNSSYQYPANISVSISSHYRGNSEYYVNTTLTNHDTSSISGILINEKEFFTYNSTDLSLVSGSPTLSSSGPLGPNQSLKMSYVVKLGNPGVYVISGTTVNYTENGTAFTYYASQAYVNGPNASFISSVNNIWKASASFTANQFHLPIIVEQIYPGIYLFDLLPLLLVILDIVLEVRAFRKWRTKEPDVTP
ncbi:MAG: hypothetical protein M1414_03695 [Candidatus Thermoplasmatota archaeon]|nr:hypothetical protein [Candidatus Thermoplasmatota archaeon]